MSRVSALLRVALAVVLLWALVATAAWLLQRRLIYFPDRSSPPAAARVIPGARDVTLRTADGLDLTAWLVEPPPETPGRRLAVLLAPGNAGNRLARAPLATPAVRARTDSPATSSRRGRSWSSRPAYRPNGCCTTARASARRW
ncbi:hypothetical protein [Paractinoplanes globisporus]|uniref:Uncharacterized protein n=1 Tax=Paractinoplanes globisporus TaxID=113565 RepID=A0ABW6WPL0_9ACTN|nr:hypothetical protein [Actinoplanes globisporus]